MTRKAKLFAFALFACSIFLIIASVSFFYRTKGQVRVAEMPFSKVAETGQSNTYTDLAGNSVSLEQYRGAPVLIVAWASWCPSCGEQLALLSRVAKEVKTSFPLLALNRKETKEAARLYLDVVGTADGLVYIVDTEDHFFKASEGYAMPELILYTADGTEYAHVRGTFTEEEIRTLLEGFISQ